MSYFLAAILPVFLPVLLLLSAHWAVRRPRNLFAYLCVSVGALGMGLVAGFVAPKTQIFALSVFVAQAALIVCFLIWPARRGENRQRHGDWFWHVTLIVIATMQWIRSDASMALTSVRVLNTELLLNLAAISCVLTLCALLVWLLCITLIWLPRLRWPVLTIAGIFSLAPLSGNVLLSAMKLQIVALTKTRLSYAARTTNLNGEITYAVLIFVLAIIVIACCLVVRNRKRLLQEARETIPSRLALAAYTQSRSVQAALAVVIAIMAFGQTYWDIVASQPPRLSEAQRVSLTEDRQARLPLEPLMDGSLHRFIWVADDGKAIRFFVINRLPGKSAPAVVFDACLLCGDKGYIQEGDEVICIGCKVHLFRPSIGKPGGCNPVPIEGWQVKDGVIIIPRSSLEAGLPIFTTVLTIDVTDPVTGRTLTNTGAAHRYAYNGKTYFFAEEWAYEAFRQAPEKYVPGGSP